MQVRFIEFMPLDAQQAWTNEQVVTQDEIVERIAAAFPLEPVPSSIRGSAPAARCRYLDGGGEIGVDPERHPRRSATRCDRVRLTAEGSLRHCLFATRELDLRSPLRGGASDDDLADAIRGEVGAKWAGHQINQVHFIRPRSR